MTVDEDRLVAALAGHDPREAFFQEIAEALPQIIFVTDGQGTVTYYNAYWYRYTGFSADGRDTEGWAGAIHPDDLSHLLARSNAADERDGLFEAEYRIRGADGTYRWHLGRSVRVHDADGRVIHRVGTAVEITEQKEAAERLRYYAILVENMPDAVVTTDTRYIIRAWSPGAERLYGWHADEVIGRPVEEVMQSPFSGSIDERHEWVTAFEREGYWRGTLTQHRKDGAPVRIAATVTQVKDEQGRVLGVTAINRDITQQHRVSENLRFLAEASKALNSSLDYRTTLATVAQLGVPEIADWCAVDMLSDSSAIEQLAVAHVDPAKAEWARELNKANPPDPNAPTGVPNVLRTGKSEFYPIITDEMLVAGAKNEEELELARRLQLSSAMTVPLTVGDRTIGAMTFVAAESGHHYTEADLAFAEEVASRAALAVENARLYREAQRAIAVRDEFMSLASHELKTPVTSLKMNVQVLQRQAERQGNDDLAGRMTRMDRQIDKLTGLINDLLSVARIQGGRLEYIDEPVDLNAIVNEAVETIQPTTRHRFEVTGTIDTPVRGDRERIGQVMTNLLTNAVKYSPKADRVIVRLDADEAMASVCVQDFGIGITPEHQPHIFEQFYRVSDPAEKTYPGLGLGLSIASEIAKRHGGAITVKSAAGAGATFTVTFPLARAKPADDAHTPGEA